MKPQTVTTEPPVPLGGVLDDTGFEDLDGVAFRLVWSDPIPVPDTIANEDVRCVVTQYLDGTIATEGEDQPLVYVSGSDYTVPVVRALADALVQAANLADRWTGQHDVDARLASARTAVEAAYTALRAATADTQGGSDFGRLRKAASYMQTALDSIADTIVVLR